MPTLKCFAAMCYQNQQVSLAVGTGTYLHWQSGRKSGPLHVEYV